MKETTNIKQYPWVFACLYRDGFKCVKCGCEKNVVVHHIDESRKTGNLNNNLSNLLSLCKSCHAKIHNQTIDQNKLEQIKELKQSGMTVSEIARKFGLTKQRISHICIKQLGIRSRKRWY